MTLREEMQRYKCLALKITSEEKLDDVDKELLIKVINDRISDIEEMVYALTTFPSRAEVLEALKNYTEIEKNLDELVKAIKGLEPNVEIDSGKLADIIIEMSNEKGGIKP